MKPKILVLNPNYPVINRFPVRDHAIQYYEKLESLAQDIGNCILKVGKRPAKTWLRKLKKFFIKTKWFKKVRIIYGELFLFRRRGRFAIRLNNASIHQLICFAKQKKAEKLLCAS